MSEIKHLTMFLVCVCFRYVYIPVNTPVYNIKIQIGMWNCMVYLPLLCRSTVDQLAKRQTFFSQRRKDKLSQLISLYICNKQRT